MIQIQITCPSMPKCWVTMATDATLFSNHTWKRGNYKAKIRAPNKVSPPVEFWIPVLTHKPWRPRISRGPPSNGLTFLRHRGRNCKRQAGFRPGRSDDLLKAIRPPRFWIDESYPDSRYSSRVASPEYLRCQNNSAHKWWIFKCPRLPRFQFQFQFCSNIKSPVSNHRHQTCVSTRFLIAVALLFTTSL